ncbi:hypothetical protein [Paenibacillus sp. MMS18-CY102]|uniref:hypothetical protein n=1 Tax=Paenibacillus sp. MMS18-CY102 TaxID=2682849 RepID=UPI00136587EB|nr:hypothetical protein [Paenibacillus sp. MMS18-CY102]MWC28796.1 hypothetical protein [Paenibacillus sp. MMS18-CY102]
MISKFISALVSAFVISIVSTLINHSPALAESDSYYSFSRQFFGGIFIILAIYIFLLIPLSIFIDGMIYKAVPILGIRQIILKIISYTLIPAIGILFILSFLANFKTTVSLAVLFGIGGLLFEIIQEALRWLSYFMKRKEN